MIVNPLAKAIKRLFNFSDEDKNSLDSVLDEIRNIEVHLVFGGVTGYGKSALVNAMFNLKGKRKMKEGFGKPNTEGPQTRIISLPNGKGQIKYTDLPGIGQNNKNSTQINKEVEKYLHESDVVVWLFRCDVVNEELTQNFIEQFPDNIRSKFVYGLSMIDKSGGDWGAWYNGQPTAKQKAYMKVRIDSLYELYNIPKNEFIIPFSSKKYYGVDTLLKQMMRKTSKKDVLRFKADDIIFNH